MKAGYKKGKCFSITISILENTNSVSNGTLVSTILWAVHVFDVPMYQSTFTFMSVTYSRNMY